MRLNDAVRAAVPSLLDSYWIFHVCGAGKRDGSSSTGYRQEEYVSDGWGDILAAADLIISRAGANALFELLALGKLILLVPLSAKASRGDQIENAAHAQQAGLSYVIDEEQLNGDSLIQGLEHLMANAQSYRACLDNFVTPDATASIVAEIVAAAR